MTASTDGTAELRVLVTTALGALPLENAIVSVSTVPDETGMRTLLHSVTTDSGGIRWHTAGCFPGSDASLWIPAPAAGLAAAC